MVWELEGRNCEWPLSARYVTPLWESEWETLCTWSLRRINITFIAEQSWQVIELKVSRFDLGIFVRIAGWFCTWSSSPMVTYGQLCLLVKSGGHPGIIVTTLYCFSARWGNGTRHNSVTAHYYPGHWLLLKSHYFYRDGGYEPLQMSRQVSYIIHQNWALRGTHCCQHADKQCINKDFLIEKNRRFIKWSLSDSVEMLAD